MCTSIAFTAGAFYFGRNMDLTESFGERVIITPRYYPFVFRREEPLKSHYAMIGIGTKIDGYPLYAEAVNEEGLCAAGLDFPGYAWYPQPGICAKHEIAPYELIPWLLGKCDCLAQVRNLLRDTGLSAIPFSESVPLVPLHWHIADKTGSIVLESTREGMCIYENPVGVMTNNPPFDFHLTNLRRYLSLTPEYPESRFPGAEELEPFGQGFGAMGLPGDFSPPSRFVKAVFLRGTGVCEEKENDAVSQVFHMLDAVAMPRGSVRTEERECDMTTYSCCFAAEKGICYYRTYTNQQLTAVDMNREDLDARTLKEFPFVREQQIRWSN